MLILSRKSNESIFIGNNIRITIASIRGRTVRIGIEAPEDVTIFREELCSEPSITPDPTSRELKNRIQTHLSHRPLARVRGARVSTK